jgi:hypothetical protein
MLGFSLTITRISVYGSLPELPDPQSAPSGGDADFQDMAASNQTLDFDAGDFFA